MRKIRLEGIEGRVPKFYTPSLRTVLLPLNFALIPRGTSVDNIFRKASLD